MKTLRIGVMLCLYALFLCLPLQSAPLSLDASQDVQQLQDQQMSMLEESLFMQLDNLKQTSQNLTDELLQLRQLHQISEDNLQDLKQNLGSTLDLFNQCAAQLTITEIQLKQQKAKTTKLFITLMVILLLFVAVRAVIIYLKFKGISIPYFVNTIL